METEATCPLCKREQKLVIHHFIPKTLHDDNWYKKRFTAEQFEKSFLVCIDCHSAIHKFHDAKELADTLNSEEKILDDEKIMKFAKFAAKQKNPIGQRSKKGRNSTF